MIHHSLSNSLLLVLGVVVLVRTGALLMSLILTKRTSRAQLSRGFCFRKSRGSEEWRLFLRRSKQSTMDTIGADIV